ncbi:fibrobacter succinogenes major paralogous domain-containing protein [Riemerella anatipestifer]|uniref:fibrobacter succinogenes major paralogous domain-containing protein n=1 Tax=Riemerella anatipestifer TaxID=34085 RepID=UPI0021AAFECD|nr:fibrobacter succinogenes major paralogous domain-containing protein [Riemerella anatipestifer]
MNKALLCTVFLPLVLNAQDDYKGRVGINTTTPQATLDISKVEVSPTMPADKPQGVLFPKLTTEERLTFSPNTKKGTLIYNKDKNCIEMYRGLIGGVHEWACINDASAFANPYAPTTATLGTVQDVKLVVFKYNSKDYLVQGSNIMETGIAAGAEITVNIPYSGASPANGAYTAYEQTLALKDGNGYMRNFKLSYPAGNFTGATGTIQAKLKNVSGATYYPALDPLDGVYRNAISNADAYTISLNGSSTTTLKVKTLTGIPDRCFDKTTFECVGYGANEKEHNFVYLPITGPDGRVWLNNNLGADYARVGSEWFDPTYQAGALDYTNTTSAVPLSNPTADQIKKDWRAYGSLFQWQRNPDGHELMTWTGSNYSDGTPKYTTTNTLSDSWTNPGHSNFILGNTYSWVTNTLSYDTTNKNLWQSGQSNNPCPVGYHVPTYAEQMALRNTILGYDASPSYTTSSKMWEEKLLRLPANGVRISNNNLNAQSADGCYWSSSMYSGYDNSVVWYLQFSSSYNMVQPSLYNRDGMSLRCIKD